MWDSDSGARPFLEGLSIRDLVHALDAFPNKRAWAVQLRRTTLALSAQDAELLHRELESRLLPYADAIGSYELLPAHP